MDVLPRASENFTINRIGRVLFLPFCRARRIDTSVLTTTLDTQINERFITPGELAAALAVHRSTISRWIQEGLVPAHKLGPRTIRILREDVQELLAKVVRN
jgi:excisionase family DNA binding protein